MRVLSVDLAYKSYAHLGIVVLDELGERFSAWPLPARELGLEGAPVPQDLARRLAEVCEQLSISTLLLDGPQAWKDPANGLEHCRVCERGLNTPGKTGLPGGAKPGNYLAFLEFSIVVFHELVARGFELWSGQASPGLALESFPSAAWRRLDLPPLPSKARGRAEDRERAARALRDLFPLGVPDGLSHDELQALVASLAGIAVERGNPGGYAMTGVAPRFVAGTWREGFIVNPTREALRPRA